MGSDLLLTYTEAPGFATPHEATIETWEAMERAALARAATRDFGDGEHDDFMVWAVDELFPEDLPSSRDEALAAVRDRLSEAVTNVFPKRGSRTGPSGPEFYLIEPRDVAPIQVKGDWYWFSGGLSSGDEPTDAFIDIAYLGESGILVEPFTDEELGIEAGS